MSAIIKMLEYMGSIDDPALNKLSDDARSELYEMLEMDTNQVVDKDARLVKEVRDYFYHSADHAGVVGFALVAELTVPSGQTTVATRFSGSFQMPWNRMGMLQYITHLDMNSTLGGEDELG